MNSRIVFLLFAVLLVILNCCSAVPIPDADLDIAREKRQYGFGYPGGYGGFGGGFGPQSSGSFNGAGIGVGGNNSGVISGGQGGFGMGK